MAQYYWAATADKVGTGVPTGFTQRFVTSGITYEVEADATSPTGYRLRIALSSTARRMLSLDAVDADGDRATVKIRALVKSQTGTTTASSYVGVAARASGAAGAGFAITAPLRRGDGGVGNRSIGMQIMDNDTLETADSFGTTAWSADTYVWVGLDLDGTGYDVLTSDDAGATTRDGGSGTVDITAAGWVGIWTFSGNADPYDIAVLTIATGASPAFYDEPSTDHIGTGSLVAQASTVAGVGEAESDAEEGTAALAAGASSVAGVGVAVGVTLVTDFDTGNVSDSLSSVTNPSADEPIIFLDTRPGANEVNGWRHATVQLNGALGKRPIFRLNRATRGVASTPVTDWIPGYTYDWDDLDAWVRAPSRTLVSGTPDYIQWQFSTAFTEDTVTVSTHPNGRQRDVELFAAYLLTLPQASPTASADSDGIYFTSPTETDDISREVGGHPMYAIKLEWGGSTTDGGPKRNLVVGTQIHAAGEAASWPSFVYMMRWIISDASQEAQDFRANFNVYWYGALQPNSLFGGADRIGWRSSTDPNRDFVIGTSSYAEIQAFRDAVIVDTSSRVDAFYNWHTWGAADGNKTFNLGWSPRDQSGVTRVPAAQALIDEGATLFGETYGDISSTSEFTDSAWAVREFGAKVAVAPEVNQNGSTSLTVYETIGENWAKMLQAVDAANYFYPSATGSLAAQASSISGVGTVVNVGQGELVAQSSQVSGNATAAGEGVGALAAQSSQVAGTGTVTVSGTGSLVAGNATVSGAGTEEGVIAGGGTLQAQSSAISGVGNVISIGTGSLVAQSATIAGLGGEVGPQVGAGALASGASAVSGLGTVVHIGTGALVSGNSTIFSAEIFPESPRRFKAQADNRRFTAVQQTRQFKATA